MSTQIKIISAVLVLILGLNIGWWAVFSNSYSKEIAVLQRQYGALRSTSLSPEDTRADTELIQAEKDLEEMRKQLPPYYDAPKIIETISSLATSKHLTFEPMQFTPEKTERLNLWKYQCRLTVSGTYDRIKAFIAEIASITPLSTITDLVFDAVPDQPGTVTSKMNLLVFCRGEDND